MQFPSSFVTFVVAVEMLMLSVTSSYSQEIEYNTHSRKIRLSKSTTDNIIKKDGFNGSEFFWAAFSKKPDPDQRKNLRQNGIFIQNLIVKKGNKYIYKIKIGKNIKTINEIIAKTGIIIGIDEIIPSDKISREIADPERFRSINTYDSTNATITAYIKWHDKVKEKEGTVILKRYGINEIITFDSVSNTFIVKSTRASLISIAEEEEISEVNEITIESPVIINARRIVLVDSLQKNYITKIFPPTLTWLQGLPYTGDSIWVWNGESGDFQPNDFFEIDGTDTLLRGDSTLNPGGTRLVKGATGSWGLGGLWFDDAAARMHGVQTATILAGNGWSSHNSINVPGSDTLQYRGIAPKSMLVDNGAQRSSQQGVGDINNHSFTSGNTSFYSKLSEQADIALSNHDTSLPLNTNYNNIGVYAAANQGDRARAKSSYDKGYYSVLQKNKNGIVVGAVVSSIPIVHAHFSSIGPTRDGRIKPDIVAPGTGLQRDGMVIEFDSIAILRNSGTVLHSWNFDNGTDGFGGELYQVIDTSRNSGIFRIETFSSSYFFMNPIFPNDTLVMNNNDSIFMRLRVSKGTPFVPDSIILKGLYWVKANSLDYVSGVTNWNKNVSSGNWINIKLPLNWTDSDTLKAIRLDMAHRESGFIVADSANDYMLFQTGTSLAAPVVSGISALMLQKYNVDVIHARNRGGLNLNIHQNACWNSTVKAILIHTATDLIDTIGQGNSPSPEFVHHGDYTPPVYGIGPDWCTGWGLVNAVKAIEYMDTTKFIEDTIGEMNILDEYFIYVPTITEKLKITLAWDDPPVRGRDDFDTTDAFLPKLVNDLDLQLVHISTCDTMKPWILDHYNLNNGIMITSGTLAGIDTTITRAKILANSASRTTGRRDSLNNVEVVEVDNPLSGLYKIRVIGTSINVNQTLPADPLNDRQDYSLVHDFPIIKDTSTTNWKVSSTGAGDVRAIADAFALTSPGDTVTINAGSYTISTPDSTNGVTLIFKPGVNINLDGFDAYIYVGTGGKIIGSENVTLSSQIVLYNTPSTREPLSSDNIIGLFGNLCRAIIVSTPGKTIKVGPGEYSIWTLHSEGLIGVVDADRSKSSIIRLYFPGTPSCAPEPPQSPSMQKTLIKNVRFDVSDENRLNALSASGNEEIEFSNCIFENFDTNGIVTTTMIALGDSGSVRAGINRFTNCLFRNFKVAVDAYCCTTQVQSPYFTNTIFENCSTDIKFPAGSQAFCHIEANQVHSISAGTLRYTGATAVNNLISSTCSTSPARNITLNNISLVDEMASDFRPSIRSSLVDNGIAKEDIGVSNTDMIFTLSRFLNASVIFSTGDTLILNNGVLEKNTIGSDVQLKTVNTLNLRPIYEIVITANYIDRKSEVRLRLNSSVTVPELPSDYSVFEAKINGYTFAKINSYDMPTVGDSTVIQVAPDNVQPAPVVNINATPSGSDALISWSASPEPDIVRYKIYRSPSATPHLPIQIASVSRSTTTYTDPAHSPGSFNYNVITYDSTGNQSASYPALPLRVEMKDNGFNETNITKPFIILTNLSDQTISGFKVRVWFSREEFLGKQIVIDRYYTNPGTINITKGVHPLNSNIVYVELSYPLTYQLSPGTSTPVDGIQFGVHYTNYYPGQWIKSNDWSYQSMSSTYNATQRVTVYNNGGMLIYGNEPSLSIYTQPPVLTVEKVLGFENCSGWSVSLGSMTQDTATKTQGIASVNFSGGGNQEIISTDLKTTNITGETSTFKMDLYVGTSQPNPYWVGTLQLYINSPSAGIVNTLIGHKELTPLGRGTFNTLSFTIPGNVLNAMRGNYNDFSFRFLLNTNTGSGPYKMDNMRFE